MNRLFVAAVICSLGLWGCQSTKPAPVVEAPAPPPVQAAPVVEAPPAPAPVVAAPAPAPKVVHPRVKAKPDTGGGVALTPGQW